MKKFLKFLLLIFRTVRKDENNLRESFDSAISSMQNEGTLENLTKTYITNLNPNENPPAVAMLHFDGAEFVKVMVDIDSNARSRFNFKEN